MSIRSMCVALALGVMISQTALAQSVASKVEYVGTSRHLQVSGVMVRDVNGLLNLAVEFANSDDSDQTGYYRLRWVDAQGFPVWEEEAWKPVVLHGGQHNTVMVTAPTAKARDFKIEFSADANWSSNTAPAPAY